MDKPERETFLMIIALLNLEEDDMSDFAKELLILCGILLLFVPAIYLGFKKKKDDLDLDKK